METYQNQESFIYKIYAYGTVEQQKKMDGLLENPELDDEVKKIIVRVRQKVDLYSGRRGSATFPPAG